ncbi:hypothetical protein C8J57DRAFT_550171, partial [Mycena rebaudengoi]
DHDDSAVRPTELPYNPATLDPNSQIRSRLAELDELIGSLVAERRRLQADLDSIVYPILSLPTEVTVENFHHRLPAKSRPSRLEAPLLLGQICHQWREIALAAPSLWQAPTFEGRPPAELLQMWLSRSGNTPLNLSLTISDPTTANALIDISLQHSRHWEDVTLGVPAASVARLDIRSLPMLRSISFRLYQQLYYDAPGIPPDTIVIRDAPLLRTLHIAATDIIPDIPWAQLTSLTINSIRNPMESLAVLQRCPALIQLTISALGTPTPSQVPITLNSLESISVNFGPASILAHLTLPRLQRLNAMSGLDSQSPDLLRSFFDRSRCAPQQLTMSLFGAPVETFSTLFLAVPRSVTLLELFWGNLRKSNELLLL